MITNYLRRRRGSPGEQRFGSRGSSVLLLVTMALTSGCAAAIGAAMAAGEIRQGLAGVQQLVTGARSLRGGELALVGELTSPLAGTYRGYQVLGSDTVRFFVRTEETPTAPILDRAGNITGYVLVGIAAASLDTLESRVEAWTAGEAEPRGRAMFFVEGTQVPEPNARTLYPAAFLGRLAPGESFGADRQDAELRRLNVEMEAPDLNALQGQGIPHELFSSVAEGVFTVRPNAEAVYQQEARLEDGRTLMLYFERMSRTVLPAGG
jgi:hypothetical protein